MREDGEREGAVKETITHGRFKCYQFPAICGPLAPPAHLGRTSQVIVINLLYSLEVDEALELRLMLVYGGEGERKSIRRALRDQAQGVPSKPAFSVTQWPTRGSKAAIQRCRMLVATAERKFVIFCST